MLKLYYSPGACSLAPHIVLEEIGRPFEPVCVMLKDGEHLKPEYLALNPHGRVPALALDGEVLTEVTAVLFWLAQSAPEHELLPHEARAQAQAISLMSWLASSVHIAFAQVWRPARFSDVQGTHAAIQDSGREAVVRHYEEIEQRLRHQPFALGTHYSVLDPYLTVFYRWGWRIGLDMERFPSWHGHAQRIAERPAVQRALAREGITLRPE